MKEEGKTFYEAPAITVVEVKIEGVVCTTDSGLNPMGEPENL